MTCLLRSSLSNRTHPGILAIIVWSLPMWHVTGSKRYFIPLCRTMMAPAFTFSLPNTLTPRNFGLLSRPFLVEPPAFFVAQRICWVVLMNLKDEGTLDKKEANIAGNEMNSTERHMKGKGVGGKKRERERSVIKYHGRLVNGKRMNKNGNGRGNVWNCRNSLGPKTLWKVSLVGHMMISQTNGINFLVLPCTKTRAKKKNRWPFVLISPTFDPYVRNK